MTAFYIENVNNTLRKTMRLFIIRCFSMLLSRCSLFVVIFTVFFFQSIWINLELSSTLMFRDTS